jgi:hypothetical protein
MKIHELADMVGGWFVGDFEPSVLRSSDMEVACKRYGAGDSEAAHVHRVATEITVVLSGEVIMNGQTIHAGSIVVLDPGEPTDFLSVTDSVTVVVKAPSVLGDKYPV